ncbi:MAG: hypothetical protein D6732_22645 [Methanobacteriota archaeon]|nr:MAG: hypothetical protein D6732_22645 [Euryarchaeota archaeon]
MFYLISSILHNKPFDNAKDLLTELVASNMGILVLHGARMMMKETTAKIWIVVLPLLMAAIHFVLASVYSDAL